MNSGTAALAVVETTPNKLDLTALEEAAGRAREYARAARAPSTRQAYQADVNAFAAWCEEHQLCALPAEPEAVAMYLTHLADRGLAVASIDRALVAISQAHKLAGLDSPRSATVVREVRKGIRRVRGGAQRRVRPLLPDALRVICAALPGGLLGVRDRALLLLGFAGALRRSELVALDVTDIEPVKRGLVLVIRRSKTDQDALGAKVGVAFGKDEATCPVRAVRRWLELARIRDGAVFRGVTRHGALTPHRLDGGDVARVIKRRARAAHIDPAELAGHSLRAGLATAAALARKPLHAIMAQTRHRSVEMVQRYVRPTSMFDDNASAGIGL